MSRQSVSIANDKHPTRTEKRNLARERVCENCQEVFYVSRQHAQTIYCPDCDGLEFVAFDGEGDDGLEGKSDYCPECGRQHYNLFDIGGSHIEVSGCRSLKWHEIISHCYSVYESVPDKRRKRRAYIGFSTGYDWDKWFCIEGDFPEKAAHMLFSREGQDSRKPQKTSYRKDLFPVRVTAPDGMVWELNKLGSRLALRPKRCSCPVRKKTFKDGKEKIYFHYTKDEREKWGKICTQESVPFMYLCDTFDFWQTALGAALLG